MYTFVHLVHYSDGTTKATQEMHDCALLEGSMGHEKGISNHEPSFLTTKLTVLLSPQVVLRSPGEPLRLLPPVLLTFSL